MANSPLPSVFIESPGPLALFLSMYSLITSSFIGGITRNEQLAAIEKFKAGVLNVLVATDAAREGIDVPDCNAVITYSHKTNVIGE